MVKEIFRLTFFCILVAVLWMLIDATLNIPPYVWPSLRNVVTVFCQRWESLLGAMALTFGESLLGLIFAICLSTFVSMLIYFAPKTENIVMNTMVAIKAIPLIAVAPLLILWFGNGFLSKSVMAATICFFPVLIGYIRGFRNITYEEKLFLKDLGINKQLSLRKYIGIKCLPYFFAGMRVASALAVVGAIVAEFVSANKGIGYLILISANRLQTDVLVSGILLSSSCGIILYRLVVVTEELLLKKFRLGTVDDF